MTNYHKNVRCGRCGNVFRDDYLKIHQQSSRCKTEKTIVSIMPELLEEVKEALRQGGFMIKAGEIVEKKLSKKRK